MYLYKIMIMKENRLITPDTAAYNRKDLKQADENNKRVLIKTDEDLEKSTKTKEKSIKKNENE